MTEQYDQDYLDGLNFSLKGEIQQAINCWMKAAAKGNAQAMYHIGEAYDFRLHDFFKAKKWYWKAIRNHNTDALVAIAIWYRYGRYVKESYRSAIIFNQRAARCGNARAMMELHELYYFGNGKKKNHPKSLYWLKRSAALGNDFAIESLAGMYLEGYGGVKKDFSQALFWYRKLADSSWDANDTLADLYFFGEQYGKGSYQWQYDFETNTCWLDDNIRGMVLLDIFDAENQSISNALYWYRRFARRDNIAAIRKLKYLYQHGLIVKKNQAQAKYWNNLAIEAQKRVEIFCPWRL